jgi:hypothetical protein
MVAPDRVLRDIDNLIHLFQSQIPSGAGTPGHLAKARQSRMQGLSNGLLLPEPLTPIADQGAQRKTSINLLEVLQACSADGQPAEWECASMSIGCGD